MYLCLLQLQSHGRVVKPYIGIKMLQLDAGKAEQLRRADASFPAVRAGILVPEVSQGSPAHHAGLRSGDVIVGESRYDRQQANCLGLIFDTSRMLMHCSALLLACLLGRSLVLAAGEGMVIVC